MKGNSQDHLQNAVRNKETRSHANVSVNTHWWEVSVGVDSVEPKSSVIVSISTTPGRQHATNRMMPEL